MQVARARACKACVSIQMTFAHTSWRLAILVVSMSMAAGQNSCHGRDAEAHQAIGFLQHHIDLQPASRSAKLTAGSAELAKEGTQGEEVASWNIAYTACGADYCEQNLIPALESFFAQGKIDLLQGVLTRPYILHIIGDQPCLDVVQSWRGWHDESALKRIAEFRVLRYDESEDNHSSVVYTFAQTVKSCSSVRLSLPALLPRVSEVLYLDADTRIVGPIATLLEEPFPAMFAMADNLQCQANAENQRCNYDAKHCAERGFHGKCFFGRAGLNTGVIRWNLDMYRALNVDSEVSDLNADADRGKIILEYGDQDILNYILHKHEPDNWTIFLPFTANVMPANEGELGEFSWSHLAYSETRAARIPLIMHGTADAFQTKWSDLGKRITEESRRVFAVDHTLLDSRSLCERSECLTWGLHSRRYTRH